MRLEGVDVSHWQPVVDWQQVRASGRTWVYVKASQSRSVIDSCFRKHADGAAAAGLAVGAYHFANPAHDPVQQAEWFHATTHLAAGLDLAPCLDLEVPAQGSGADAIRWAVAFVERAEVLFGRRVTLYTGDSYWRHYLGDPVVPALSRCALWVARYDNSPPQPFRNWPRWTAWQYAGGREGSWINPVPGIGPCDKSVLIGELDNLRGLPTA